MKTTKHTVDLRYSRQQPQGRETGISTDADGLIIRKYGRYWAVYDPDGTLVVVTVYKKGAQEVVRRLTAPLSRTGKEGDDQS